MCLDPHLNSIPSLIYYSSGACVRNMYENKRFVIGKLNFVSYQFVLGAFPLEPSNSLDFEMSQHTYTVCVKGGEHGLKMPSINKYKYQPLCKTHSYIIY